MTEEAGVLPKPALLAGARFACPIPPPVAAFRLAGRDAFDLTGVAATRPFALLEFAGLPRARLRRSAPLASLSAPEASLEVNGRSASGERFTRLALRRPPRMFPPPLLLLLLLLLLLPPPLLALLVLLLLLLLLPPLRLTAALPL